MAPSSQPNGRVPVTCLRSRSLVDPPLSPGPGPGILIPQGIARLARYGHPCFARSSVHLVVGVLAGSSYFGLC